MNSTIERLQDDTDNRPPLGEWTDEELLGEYRERENRRAYEELVYRYERELYNYLRRYLHDDQMAEDTFQLTFLQVHLKCGQFQPGRKVRPWLYAVATNQAIDAQRRNRRHQMVSLDRRAGGDGGEEMSTLVDLLDGEQASPAEEFETAERSEVIRDSVEKLPEPLRRVVLLVYYQGLKYREAAEALSIPVGTVKSRLHAAIHKLNHALTPTDLSGND